MCREVAATEAFDNPGGLDKVLAEFRICSESFFEAGVLAGREFTEGEEHGFPGDVGIG